MADDYFGMLSQAPVGVQLEHLIVGYWISQAIAVAAELQIPDRLADGPKESAELAAATGTHTATLYRLLRALAGVGLFTEPEPGRFDLTPMSTLLRTDEPASLRAMALYHGGEVHWRVWRHLLDSVQTGQPAFDQVMGMSPWEYRAQHPELNAIFNAYMRGSVLQVAAAVVEAYDFSPVRRLVDVGGGHGALLAAVLGANPELQGVLFDLPHVAQGAKEHLEAAGVLGRCEIVGGDMFAALPAAGDAYVFSRVIHDWDDEQAVIALANCRQAMAPEGTLLLVEQVIPPGDTPSYGKLVDLNMLVATGGRERTEAEYRALYAQAGFTLTRVIPTRSRIHVIEGVPANP